MEKKLITLLTFTPKYLFFLTFYTTKRKFNPQICSMKSNYATLVLANNYQQ